MKKIILSIVAGVCLISNFHIVHAEGNYNVIRISGSDRYETSLNIANNFFSNDSKNVIVASGDDFPDAITSGILSKKLGGPIFLVRKNQSPDKVFGNYIHESDLDRHMYILGGDASVSSEYEKVPSYPQITRLSGPDRFSTNSAIINCASIEKGTPVIIVNGFQFADALSVSSVSSVKGYPIILSTRDKLNDSAVQMLKNIEPSQVFVIGGQSSISNNVISDIKNTIENLDNSKITRIGGEDRYETSLNVCKYFNLDGDTAIIASGEDFADALSGTALAAKVNAPIILTNGKDISAQKSYLDNKSFKKLVLLGGQSSISSDVESKLTGIDNTIITFPDKNLENEIRKKINKLSGDIYTNDVRSIVKLDVHSNEIRDISGIDKFINLKELDLSDNRITNLQPLKNLVNLENVNLSKNDLSDISGVDKLVNLKNLSLGGNDILSIDSLKNLDNLENLELSTNSKIIDISPIKNLNKLKSLSLKDDKIVNIDALGGLNSLEKLDLMENKLNNIDFVEKLTNLQYLELGENEIADISPLKNLTNLNCLILNRNKITNISVLRNLTNLSELYLGGNKITDISSLKQLKNLKNLILESASLNNSEIKELEKLLPNCDVVISQIYQ